MEEFTEYSSEVVEFPSTWKKDKNQRFQHTSSLTDPCGKHEDKNSQTNEKFSVLVQTEMQCQSMGSADEKKLAAWLKKIYPAVDVELSKGITPLHDATSGYADHDISIKPYQKITDDTGCNQGSAIWLSVRTNNAPLLVVATSFIHNDWCDHLGKCIKVFTPKRAASQDFVIFSEFTSLPVKSCVKCLVTNSFNKDQFAGGTFSGDLYIWEYKTGGNSEEVRELHSVASQHSCIIATDWLNETEILTCHSDCFICLWKVGKEVIKDKSFKVMSKKAEVPTIVTAISCISQFDFIVGTQEGQLYSCSTKNTTRNFQDCINPVVNELDSHSFAVTSLIKTKYCGTDVVISCDLSGELYFYDIQNSEEEPTLVVKMPLPFKNYIGCSNTTNYIYSPGFNGSLDVFRVSNGKYFQIDGNLDGKGNVIKMSDNGCWLVTGVYKGVFQIFKVDNQ